MKIGVFLLIEPFASVEVQLQRAQEILQQLEATSGHAVNINRQAAKQIKLFPETNPLLDELKEIDINALSPMEALNKLYEWQRRFISPEDS